MINISIDPPDLKSLKKAPVSQEEDLSINEIESVYELVSEAVFDNNIPETDEDDIDTDLPAFDLYCSDISFSTPTLINYPIVHYSYYYNKFSLNCPEPNSPPPKYA